MTLSLAQMLALLPLNTAGEISPSDLRAVVTALHGGSTATPDSVSGLAAWWKADSLSLNDNDAVSAWSDSASSYNLAQATSTNQPIYKTNIQNSLPVVRFDGTNDGMYTSTAPTATDFTLFIVFAARSTPSNNGAIFTAAPSTGNDYDQAGAFALTYDATAANQQINLTRITNMVSLLPTRHMNGTFQILWVRSGKGQAYSGISSAVHSQLRAYTTTAAINPNTFVVGARFLAGAINYTSNPSPLDYGEIAFYNVAVPLDDVARIVRGLASRWGLAL